MWNTVLFDLDGTLTDSAPGITRCVQYALEKEFGIRKQPEELIEFVGPPLKEQFMLYTGCSEEMAERAVERYRERYRPVGIFENSLYPGIPELLKQLHDEHFTIALTSSKPEVFCRQILEAFGIIQYFDVICGSDMAGRHTDKAEVAERVIRKLRMDNRRSEIVLVGDRKYDIIGAKQCGIGSIGVSFGYGSREELEYEWPDCIVDNVTELRNVLIGQARAAQRNGSYMSSNRNHRYAADGSVLFKLWRIGYPLLIHLVISNLTVMIISMFFVLFTLMTGGNTADAMNFYASQTVLFLGIADALVIPAGWFFFRKDEQKRIENGYHERLLKKNKIGAAEYVRIAVMVIGFAAVLNVLISFLPIHDEAYESASEQMFENTVFGMQLIVIGVLAPVAEELIFRGLIFRRLRDYSGFLWALIFSGLIFGVYHGNITQGIFAFIMGMLFAAIYEHYGTIWATVAAHMSNNLFATVQNYVMNIFDVSDAGFFTFVLLIAAAALACFLYILMREERVNTV